MQTDIILNGILALLVAERDGTTGRPTERVLADAGLTDEHIAMVTGSHPARRDGPPVTAFGHVCIDRASAQAQVAGRTVQPVSSSLIASSMSA